MHLAVVVLQAGSSTSRAARRASRWRATRSGAGVEALARRLDADQLDAAIVDESVEDAHRVRAAADAGDDRVAAGARSRSSICARASLPMTDWKSRTMRGYGAADDGADDVVACRRTLVTQSRIASLVASLSVRVPLTTGTTVAPSSFMRYTLSDWRRMSSSPMYTTHSRPKRAHTVAVATPCCPAPVSAMMRRLPMRRASSAWPTVLLILCAPV